MKRITLYIEGLTKAEPVDLAEPIDIIELADIPDGSCEYIMAKFVMDYAINREELLSQILKKVAYEGTIVIYGGDLISIAKDITVMIIETTQAQQMLYNMRTGLVSLQDVVSDLKRLNFTILKQRLHDHEYSIEAIRNN